MLLLVELLARGDPDQTRKVKMGLIDSCERKSPLEHEFREEFLIELCGR